MHQHQSGVSFRHVAGHFINRCIAKCYRFFLPRNMRNPLGRYRQIYLSLVLFAVFNIAFWAGFFSSRLGNEYRRAELSDEDMLEGQRLSNQEDLKILRKHVQWGMNSRRKMDNPKYYRKKRNLKYKSSVGTKPSRKDGWQRYNKVVPNNVQTQGKITNAWMTTAPAYTKEKEWDTITIITNNDIEKDNEVMLSLPTRIPVVKVTPIEERQSVDDYKSRDEPITEGGGEEDKSNQDDKVINAHHEKKTAPEAINDKKEERKEYSHTDVNAGEIIRSSFLRYTDGSPTLISKNYKKENDKSVEEEMEDQKDQNDIQMESVIPSNTTDVHRPQSEGKEIQSEEETVNEEDEDYEEVSPLTSVRRKNATELPREEMTHERDQLQKERPSDTKQVEGEIERRHEVDRDSQPEERQDRIEHQIDTENQHKKSMSEVNDGQNDKEHQHKAAGNEESRRASQIHKDDDQQERTSKDDTEEKKEYNQNDDRRETNERNNHEREAKENEDETEESESEEERDDKLQNTEEDVNRQMRDTHQGQRRDIGGGIQNKEQQKVSEKERRKEQHQQQQQQQQQHQQQQPDHHHHHQQQQQQQYKQQQQPEQQQQQQQKQQPEQQQQQQQQKQKPEQQQKQQPEQQQQQQQQQQLPEQQKQPEQQTKQQQQQPEQQQHQQQQQPEQQQQTDQQQHQQKQQPEQQQQQQQQKQKPEQQQQQQQQQLPEQQKQLEQQTKQQQQQPEQQQHQQQQQPEQQQHQQQQQTDHQQQQPDQQQHQQQQHEQQQYQQQQQPEQQQYQQQQQTDHHQHQQQQQSDHHQQQQQEQPDNQQNQQQEQPEQQQHQQQQQTEQQQHQQQQQPDHQQNQQQEQPEQQQHQQQQQTDHQQHQQQQQPEQQQHQQQQKPEQQQHEKGSDNNNSESRTEAEQHQNRNQVKEQEKSRDSKAVQETEGKKQSNNPSERQETTEKQEEKQQVKEEQQNRKPTERQETTNKQEEEEKQQAEEERRKNIPREDLQQETVRNKERTQLQVEKQLNNNSRFIHKPEGATSQGQYREQEQSKNRKESSKTLRRQREDKSEQDPYTPGATRKTGFLKQLPIIDMVDLEEKRPSVLIVIFVLTSALRYDRRQGIRDTWWTKCKQPQAACMFVTDGYVDETLYDDLLGEKDKYDDLIFLPVDEGLNFGMRLLFLMEWVQTKYKPEFFLRIDDDYFLCIERLLDELPQRPKKNVVWGFWHCDLPTVTFIDESFILLSYDVVETFLSWDEETLLCHPFGDQQLGIWLNRVPYFKSFFDFRLHHHPPASKNSTIRNMNNICDRFLGLHGTYPEDMRRFWSRANDGKKALTRWVHVYPRACHHRPYFKWQDIKPQFRYKPELCAKNPRWNNRREMWAGRQ